MKNFIKPLLASALALSLMASAQAADIDVSKLPHRSDDANAPVVYMTTQIIPEAMLKIYETLAEPQLAMWQLSFQPARLVTLTTYNHL